MEEPGNLEVLAAPHIEVLETEVSEKVEATISYSPTTLPRGTQSPNTEGIIIGEEEPETELEEAGVSVVHG